MVKIGIVEDDLVIREELSKTLLRYGYEVECFIEFSTVLDEILKSSIDLLLLDINLPYFDGYHICREIRRESNIPIIMVTSRNSDMDELMSINIGADDFITKPYNIQVLLARVERLLSRFKNNREENSLYHRGLKLNLSKGIVTYDEKEVELTKNELKILAYLIKNKEKIVLREDLMKYLWDSDYFVDDNTLSVNITRIRKKLLELGLENIIETKRGMGYIMS